MSEAERRPAGRPATGQTPKQGLRVPTDEWQAVAAAAREQGGNTTSITREFYAWYLRRPGARLPKRPVTQAEVRAQDVARVAAAAVASRAKAGTS